MSLYLLSDKNSLLIVIIELSVEVKPTIKRKQLNSDYIFKCTFKICWGLPVTLSILWKTTEAVLFTQRWVLSRNFTQLSLSSETQCHVNRTVTVGPAFVCCCWIMGEGFYSDLGITLVPVLLVLRRA